MLPMPSGPAAKADRRRVRSSAEKKLVSAPIEKLLPRKLVEPAAKAPPPTPPLVSPRGKLGAVVAAISTETGATIAELGTLTGWQAHTARAALTRLRQRGFGVHLTDLDGRKAYRLDTRS